MSIFSQEYELGGERLYALTRAYSPLKPLRTESDLYVALRERCTELGWTYYKMDVKHSVGFPDILVIRGSEYVLMECKLLRKKALVSVKDDLKWEFGQIPTALKLVRSSCEYVMVVGREHTIAFLKGAHHGIPRYADFIEQV